MSTDEGALTVEDRRMPLYLSRFSYTPETWARLVKNPEDRRDAARRYIESVGGTLHGFWYAFGAHDGLTLWEAPDNVSMAAVAIAIGGGGAVSCDRHDRAADRRRDPGSPSARASGCSTARPAPEASPAGPVSSAGAEVAQWQSIGFVNRRLWVRLPPSAPSVEAAIAVRYTPTRPATHHAPAEFVGRLSRW